MNNTLLKSQLTKQKLEEYLGYEINNFKEEPVIVDEEVVGISLCIEPKSMLSFIDIDIIITPTTDQINLK
jgi:hypothetical protein